MNNDSQLFSGGRNIALKLPPHEFDSTVKFYRDVLGLKQLPDHLPAVVFEFGPNQLWMDKVATMTQAEVWLELRTPDTAAAALHLDKQYVTRCDAVEELPDGFDGFWISSPANIVHLVHGKSSDA